MAVLSHQGKVIQFEILSGASSKRREGRADRDVPHLRSTTFSFCSSSRHFVEAGQCQEALSGEGAKQIVTAHCVAEQRTGRVLPCVLIEDRISENDFINSLVYYVPEMQRFYVFGRFRSAVSLLFARARLVNGPMICWIESSDVRLAKKDASSRNFQVQSIREKEMSISVESRILFACVDSPNALQLVIATDSKSSHEKPVEGYSEEELGEMKWTRCSVQTGKSGKAKQINGCSEEQWIPDCDFVPHVYASITRCMHAPILDAVPGTNYSRPTFSSSAPAALTPSTLTPSTSSQRSSVLIATSMKQLLDFKNGRLHKLAWIPFDDATRIVPMVTAGEEMIVVMSATGQVCVVGGSPSAKVLKEWSGVSSLFVDDFLGNGRYQLLLLLNSRTSGATPFPEFILTDMGLCLVTSAQLLLPDEESGKGLALGASGDGSRAGWSQSSPCPQNLITAVGALEMRVMHGLTSLKEQELSSRRKEEVIHQSTGSLMHMAAGQSCQPQRQHGLTSLKEQELSSRRKEEVIHQSTGSLMHMAAGQSCQPQRQPTLVHLCGSSDIQQKSQPTSLSRDGNVSRLKVTSGWQRVMSEKWVIGLNITNVGQCAVHCLHILVLPMATRSLPELVQSRGRVQYPSQSLIDIDVVEGVDREYARLWSASKRRKLEFLDMPSEGRTRESSLTPGRSVDAVAAIDVPDFRDGPTASCRLALQWKECALVSGNKGSVGERREVRSVMCGHVHLTASDVIEGKLAVTLPHGTEVCGEVISRMDELALNAVQLATPLQATSTYTQLACLPRILSSRMGFRGIHGGVASDTMWCTDGLLKGTRVYINAVKSRTAEIKVHTQDERKLMLFHHAMKSYLPSDVQFCPRTPPECVEDSVRSCVAATKLELWHTRRLLEEGRGAGTGKGEATSRARVRAASGDEESDPELDKLLQLREEFDGQSSRTNWQCHLSAERAEPLRNTAFELKENTDNAFATLSHCLKNSTS